MSTRVASRADRVALLDGRETVEVPADAFALLMGYCHTPSGDVPDIVRTHPAYPAEHDGKKRHLSDALRPAFKEAVAKMLAAASRKCGDA